MRRYLVALSVGASFLLACERGTPDVRAQSTPPALPPVGSRDSLLGLFTLPPDSLTRLETREHGYEESSAVVYGIDGGWLLVGLPDGGRTWLRRRLGEFVPLEPLLRERLTYLSEAWDGTLRFAPDTAATPEALARREPAAGAGEGPPVRLLGTRMVNGALWLEVEVLDQVCEGGESRPVARGWLRAWSNGVPTVWYHSRGC